jgi:hypothetical protein
MEGEVLMRGKKHVKPCEFERASTYPGMVEHA